jgi:hypothetical protein
MPAEGIHEEEPERDRCRTDEPGDGSIGEKESTAGSLEPP